jgi:hypothetical protein
LKLPRVCAEPRVCRTIPVNVNLDDLEVVKIIFLVIRKISYNFPEDFRKISCYFPDVFRKITSSN